MRQARCHPNHPHIRAKGQTSIIRVETSRRLLRWNQMVMESRVDE